MRLRQRGGLGSGGCAVPGRLHRATTLPQASDPGTTTTTVLRSQLAQQLDGEGRQQSVAADVG